MKEDVAREPKAFELEEQEFLLEREAALHQEDDHMTNRRAFRAQEETIPSANQREDSERQTEGWMIVRLNYRSNYPTCLNRECPFCSSTTLGFSQRLQCHL